MVQAAPHPASTNRVALSNQTGLQLLFLLCTNLLSPSNALQYTAVLGLQCSAWGLLWLCGGGQGVIICCEGLRAGAVLALGVLCVISYQWCS